MTGAKFLMRVQNEKGIAVVFVAILIVAFIGLGALVVDLGYMYVTKGELQNAADAGALAGATKLLQGSSSTIQWTLAQQNATPLVLQNQAAGAYLTDAQVEAGYWNTNQTPAGIQSKGIIPTANDMPAVQVTVSKSAGSNGGPVPAFFAKIFGWNEFSVSASAVAAMKPAGTMTGNILPIAMDAANVNAHPLNNGQSAQFDLKPDDTQMNGVWTLLNEGNGGKTVKDMTVPNNVLTNPVSVGDTISQKNGVAAAIYDDMAIHNGSVFFMAVVDNFTHNKVIGFVAFYLTSSDKTTKTITGHFVGPILTDFSAGGNGANYGLYSKHTMLVK